MKRTKRNLPDYRCPPTTEELKAMSTGFSYKAAGDTLRITFSPTHVDDPKRSKAWNATVCRTRNGTRRSVCVYAGTDNTLPKRWSGTLQEIKRKAQNKMMEP